MAGYKDKNGVTRAGTFLRGLKNVAPDILDLAGIVTQKEGLRDLADKIRGTSSISIEDKEIALSKINLDIAEAKELTERWVSDNNTEGWLPRNIRPLVVANFTILIDFVLISSMWGKPLGEAYLPILMTMGVTAIGGYFTLREYGKGRRN